jgi:hypothetical protein
LKRLLGPHNKKDRKLRLFACACARRLWHLLSDDRFRRAIEVAEQFADGEATDEQRDVIKRACEAAYNTPIWTCAAAAARGTLSSNPSNAAWNVAGSSAGEDGDEGEPAWEAHRAKQADLFRDIFGPYRPVKLYRSWLSWQGGAVPKLAQEIYENRCVERLPALADLLEEAGCSSADILEHCRSANEHVRGCWVLDLLLGKK